MEGIEGKKKKVRQAKKEKRKASTKVKTEMPLLKKPKGKKKKKSKDNLWLKKNSLDLLNIFDMPTSMLSIFTHYPI